MQAIEYHLFHGFLTRQKVPYQFFKKIRKGNNISQLFLVVIRQVGVRGRRYPHSYQNAYFVQGIQRNGNNHLAENIRRCNNSCNNQDNNKGIFPVIFKQSGSNYPCLLYTSRCV